MNVISVSRTKDVLDKRHKFFDVVKIHFEDIPNIITKDTWSPITWIQGSRAACNYTSCEFLVLDFDDGSQTIDDIKYILQIYKLRGIIGTSKSHQLEKHTKSGQVTPPCDRFRLVIPFERNIEDAKTYSFNLREAMDINFPGADRACQDAARFFFPCKDIVYVSEHTGAYPALPYEHRRRYSLKGTGCLPPDVISLLDDGIPVGMRNSKCFRAACCMLDTGNYSKEEIFNGLMKAMQAPLPDRELTRIINQAERYV